MKWINGETWGSEKNTKSAWHRYFAWRPVVIGEKTMPDGKIRLVKAWLCMVERKGRYFSDMDMFSGFWSWKYREITRIE